MVDEQHRGAGGRRFEAADDRSVVVLLMEECVVKKKEFHWVERSNATWKIAAPTRISIEVNLPYPYSLN